MNKQVNYSAPALDKGLEILEFMAGKSSALSIAEIAAALGRSKTEIYRMLLTLETRGYIRRGEGESGYVMTGRLFDLGMRHAPKQQLLDVALPYMRTLARQTEQSCHISVASGDGIVALTRVESESSIGFSVRVGFRTQILHSTSGRLLYAFQTRHQQAIWLNQIRNGRPERQHIRTFVDEANRARAQAFLIRPSYYTVGITDICAPLFQGRSELAVGTLNIPFVTHRPSVADMDAVAALLRKTAEAISRELY